jgi:hypothetical protein
MFHIGSGLEMPSSPNLFLFLICLASSREFVAISLSCHLPHLDAFGDLGM